MENLITYEKTKDNYGVIQLNRSEKRNAISLEMAEQLKQNIIYAKKEDIKFLLITGEGDKLFCAGGDLNDLHGELSVSEAEQSLLQMMEVLEEIIKFPVPVIALLNGNALGGGCELATACDIRIAKKGTVFGFVQSNIGILPGWGGGAILYKKVAPSFALDWLTTGKLYPGEVLYDKGWIHQIIEADTWDVREEYLKYYINKSVKQMRLLKEQFKSNINIADLTEQMRKEVKNTAGLWDSPEHKAAVLNFFNRKS